MKRNNLYPVFGMMILFLLVAFKPNREPDRKALIVAIGNYKAGTNWSNLASLKDDTIITTALEKQGFGDIRHLVNEKATIDGIRKEFARLENDAKAGDILYIHFSSHGQQIWDDSQTADELDGYDEAIVTWDAPARYVTGYTGDKHLRDDELGKMVNALRAKVGPEGDVLVVVDACHSGTALRGDVTRGNQGAMAPPDFNPLNVKKTEDAASVDGFTAETSEMSPVVLYSASRAHEPNQEHNGYGSLSLAITNSFNKIRQGDSYRSLFAYIAAEMTNMGLRQVPVMEGKVDRGIFGGHEVKQNNYYPVKNIWSYDIVIDGGTLSGIYAGSKIAFMPAGSREYDPAKAVFTATVRSADMAKSYISHKGELQAYQSNAKQLWAFVVEQSYGAYKLNVGGGDLLPSKLKSEVKENLKALTFVEWADKEADVYVNYRNSKYTLELNDCTVLYENIGSKEAINVYVSGFMQGKLMREAVFRDPDINVELFMTPRAFRGYDADDNAMLEMIDSASRCIGGIWEMGNDDIMFLTLANRGSKDVYISILEIDPAGVVKVVLPDYDNNENAFDYLLPAGKTIPVKDFARKLGPRNGQYTLKVFATDVPVNFRSIYNVRGNVDPNEYVHPAAQLFQYSYRTRGENLAMKKTSGGGTTKEYIIRFNNTL